MIILWLAIACCAGATDGPLNVCHVLENLEQYRDKRITIRGRYSWGLHGGQLGQLADLNYKTACPGNPNWPSVMDVVSSDAKYIPGDNRPRKFEPDNEQVFEADKQLGKLINEGAKVIIATFDAELRSKPGIKITKTKTARGSFRYMGNGYGQGGMYAAAVLILGVEKYEAGSG